VRTDDSLQISEHLWQALQRSGLAMAPFGEALGGVGLAAPEHQGHLCSILRILGAADLSFARLFEGHVNAISLRSACGPQQPQDNKGPV
jgi:alkylation response protein AidB-like acyl-CoA dehydrogenase